MGADDLLLLGVRGIDELLTHEDAHHVLTVLGRLVGCLMLLLTRVWHWHVCTVRLGHGHRGLVHVAAMLLALTTRLPNLLLIGLHLGSLTHGHLLRIDHLVLVVVEVLLLLAVIRAVGHSCPALGPITAIVEAVASLVGCTTLTSVHTAALVVLELAHEETQARNELDDVLVAVLHLTRFLLVELLAVILLLLTLLATLLGLTEVDLQLAASNHELRTFLGHPCRLSLLETDEASRSFRHNLARLDLAKVSKNSLKFFPLALRVNIAHNQVKQVHTALELESAFLKLDGSLLFGLELTDDHALVLS